MKIVAAAEEAVMIYLAERPDETVLETVRALSAAIEDELGEWVVDLVPSFTTLTVYFDVSLVDYYQLRQQLMTIARTVIDARGKASEVRRVDIPVYYGEDVAEDLSRVSEITGVCAEQVIELHSQCEVRVYALGFRPGFGFMGNLPEALRVPRLDTPRQRVPTGAVAIAESQTAVYPDVSPGGWNIIGRCPLPMFDRSGDEPHTFLQVGDRVRFTPVNREEFLQLGGQL